MRAKSVLIAGAGLAYVAGAAYAGLYLAAGLYFLLIKALPSSVDAGTFMALWQQLSGEPAHLKKLQAAAGISAALVYLVPLLALSSLRRKPRGLHGDARFASPREVDAAGLNAEKGILVGKYQGRYLVFGGQQFALLAAPTRQGKGVGAVIPNLLNWPDSAVVLDVKLENFQKTSGFRSAHGQSVFLFNPFTEDFCTHRWNLLSSVSRDANFRIGDIQSIAATFYPSGHSASSSNEAFFNDQAQNLFMGLVLYLMETPERPCTMGEVLRQGSGDGQFIHKHLSEVLKKRSTGPRALSKVCVDALNRFLSNSENTLASIKSSFEAPLLIFANPIVDAATSSSDFDLRELRRKRMSIYVGIQPRHLESASRLLNVFFSQLVNLNTDELPENNPALKYQTLLVMDEFTAIGRIPILAKSVAFLAGYGLRLLPIVQSLEQIEHTYGKEAARNFLKNHDVKIVFPPDDIEDAEKVSRTLGYCTEKALSKGESRSAGWGRNANRSQSENVSDQRRALLLPQEVREMSQDQQIILKSYCKPILCQKIRYYEDAVFKKRLLPPCPVAAMDMGLHHAVVERRVRAVTAAELSSTDLSHLTINFEAITSFSGDPQNPSVEEATAVVDSFFAQLDWADNAGGDSASSNTPPPTAGGMDLSVFTP